MKKVKNLSCDLHFPIIQAIPTIRNQPFWKRVINFLTYRRKFQIMKDDCLWVPSLFIWIFLPKGFIFDGASVPKILNSIYNPTGMLLLGAAPHDFGYRYKGLLQIDAKGNVFFVSYTKKELDDIFNALCAYESEMKVASKTATFTLTIAGFLGWRENRKKNCILPVDFPEVYIEE